MELLKKKIKRDKDNDKKGNILNEMIIIYKIKDKKYLK